VVRWLRKTWVVAPVPDPPTTRSAKPSPSTSPVASEVASEVVSAAVVAANPAHAVVVTPPTVVATRPRLSSTRVVAPTTTTSSQPSLFTSTRATARAPPVSAGRVSVEEAVTGV
jgi:hypothetical protein